MSDEFQVSNSACDREVIVGIDGMSRRSSWHDDWRVSWPSPARMDSLPALESILAGATRDSDRYRAIVDEDLAEELSDLAEHPTGIAFDDALAQEVDQRIRANRIRVTRAFYAELYRGGPDRYLAALRGRSEPLRPTAGLDDFLGAAVDVSEWTALAVGSGMLGNAAYDLLSRVTSSYRRRRAAVKEIEEAEYSAARGQKFSLSILTPLTLDEAKAVAYLSACAAVKEQESEAEIPTLDSISLLRQRLVECHEHGNQVRLSCADCGAVGWSLILALDERIFRIWIPRGDPLTTTVRVEPVW